MPALKAGFLRDHTLLIGLEPLYVGLFLRVWLEDWKQFPCRRNLTLLLYYVEEFDIFFSVFSNWLVTLSKYFRNFFFKIKLENEYVPIIFQFYKKSIVIFKTTFVILSKLAKQPNLTFLMTFEIYIFNMRQFSLFRDVCYVTIKIDWYATFMSYVHICNTYDVHNEFA